MESKQTFDLDVAIRDWRKSMAASGLMDGSRGEELECHLRDSASALQRAGLSEEESFLIAVRRLGDSRALVCEFAKVHRSTIWLHRLFWMVLGLHGWAFANAFSALIANGAVFFGLHALGYEFPGGGNFTLLAVAVLAQLVVLAAMAGAIWRARGFLSDRILGAGRRLESGWMVCAILVAAIGLSVLEPLMASMGHVVVLRFISISQWYSVPGSIFWMGFHHLKTVVPTACLIFLARRVLTRGQTVVS